MYIDDRRRSPENSGLTTSAKVAIAFVIFLIFSVIFYYFDDSSAADSKRGTGGGGVEQVTEASRIRNIREDCHDGIAPF
jgi:hypothetical protein